MSHIVAHTANCASQAAEHWWCRLVRAILWAGLAGFIVQWSFFLRLTFWELSWDVMEPVTYFVSSGVSIVICEFCSELPACS